MRKQQAMKEPDKAKPPLLLMQMARGLLDRSGERAILTACHLQAAIDAATGEMPVREGERMG